MISAMEACQETYRYLGGFSKSVVERSCQVPLPRPPFPLPRPPRPLPSPPPRPNPRCHSPLPEDMMN